MSIMNSLFFESSENIYLWATVKNNNKKKTNSNNKITNSYEMQ